MDNNALIPAENTALGQVVQDEDIIALVTNGLSSDVSKKMYAFSIRAFLAWRRRNGNPALTPALVEAYKDFLLHEGRRSILARKGKEPGEENPVYAPASVNLQLCAVRRLFRKAAQNDLLDPAMADRASQVEGVHSSGRRIGRWLTREEAQELLHQPDISTLRGLRDRALLAVLLGAGLRRSEAVSLTCRHFQKREGRWVIVDIRGKGSRMRSVPIPFWVKDAVDGWLATAGIRSGAVFRKILKNHRIAPHPLSHQSVHNIVKQYGILFDDGIAAHDLRRTFAKLARQGGSPIDQIQLTLGHASVATTERYLGTEQDLTDAPADHLGLEL